MTQIPGDVDTIIAVLERIELAIRRTKAKYTDKMSAQVFADDLASEICDIIIRMRLANAPNP